MIMKTIWWAGFGVFCFSSFFIERLPTEFEFHIIHLGLLLVIAKDK